MSRSNRRTEPSSRCSPGTRRPPSSIADTAQRRIWLLETLHQVNAHIAESTDIVDSLADISHEICERFGFNTVAIGAIDGNDVVYRSRSIVRDGDQFRLPVTAGVTGRVIRTRTAELIEDVSRDPDFIAIGEPVRREVAVPIVVGDSVYGVLNVEASDDTPLGTEEFDVMRSIATSLGVAIERSRQRLEQQRRLSCLSALQYITGRIAGRERVDENVSDILLEIASSFDFDFVSLGFLQGDDIHFHASFDAYSGGSNPIQTFPASSGITGRVARTGEPAFVTCVDDDPDFVSVRSETTQEICVPIYVSGEVAGVLNVEMSDRRRADQGDFDIIQSIGDQIGLAIANQRRISELEQRNAQLRTLERVTATIASKLLIREALPEILVELERGFGFGSTGIGLIVGDRLVFQAIRESDDRVSHVDRYETHGIPLGTGVTGRVARSGIAELIEDVTQDPDFLPTSPDILHEICVPIRVGQQTVGVLNVETTAERPLNAHDAEVLSVIADHIGIAMHKSDLYVAEQEGRRAIEAIQRVSTIVASTLNVDEALQLIVSTLAEAFAYPFVSLRLLDGDVLVLAASTDPSADSSRGTVMVGHGVCGRVALTGTAEFVRDVTLDPAYIRSSPDITSEVCVPIVCDSELVGVLNIEGNRARPVTQQDLELMQTFAEHAGTVLQNARMYARVQHLATRDPVTGMANHREFQLRLRAEVARASRANRPLSLLMFDLDSFKRINDSYGHLIGDDVLRTVAVRLNSGLREGDVLARYAGDEFVAILPDTDRAAAECVKARLIERLESDWLTVGDGQVVRMSVSIGVASFPADGTTAEDLIERADSSMYVEKRKRRGNAPPGVSDASRHT